MKIWHRTGRYCGHGELTRSLSLACVVFSFVACSMAAQKRQKKTDYGVGVEVARGLQKFQGTCISYQIFFISSDFFQNLRMKILPDGPRFVKDKTKYLYFPDEMFVDVQATPSPCLLPPLWVPPFGYGEGLMSEPSFELNRRGVSGDLRPVTLLSKEEKHGMVWNYFLRIPSKDVPLTDKLMGDVSLRKGTTHIQFNASLVP